MLSNIASWKEVNFDDGHSIKYDGCVLYEAIDKWSSILIVRDVTTNDRKCIKVFDDLHINFTKVPSNLNFWTLIKTGKEFRVGERLTKENLYWFKNNMNKLVPVIYDGQNYKNLSIKDCVSIWGDDSEAFNLPGEDVEIMCGKKTKKITIPSVPKEYKDYLNYLKRIEEEVKCMDKVKNCEYVVQIYDVLRYTHKSKPTDESIFIVMELIEDGRLLEQIGYCGCESTIGKKYFKQLLEGLYYCHQQGVCHRDISANNVLYSTAKDKVKLVDFGLSKEQMNGRECGSFIGTKNYYAPEIESSSYCGFKADCFSCGLIFYEILTGKPPFNIITSYVNCPEYNDYKHWVEIRDNNNPDFLYDVNAYPDPDYPRLFNQLPDSNLLKHFMCCMLHPNPEKRYDIEHLLNHPYLNIKTFDSDDDNNNNNNNQLQFNDNDTVISTTPVLITPIEIPMPTEERRNPTSRSIMSSVPSLDMPTSFPELNNISLTQSCISSMNNRDPMLRSNSLFSRSDIPPLKDGSKRFSRFYTNNDCEEILNKIKDYIEKLDEGREAIDAYQLVPKLDEANYSLLVYSKTNKLVLQFKVYSSFTEHLVDVRNYKMQTFIFKKFFNELLQNLQSCVSRTYDFRFFEKRKRSRNEVI